MAATETLATVRTEFLARGFDELDPTTRGNRAVNDAYAWLCKKALWPFLEATATGAAPLTVADIGVLMSVTDTANGNNPLHWKDRRTLVEMYGDLTTTGVPMWFYIEGGNVVKTYPVGGTLAVRYHRNPSKLVADADVLLVPDGWVQLVIDRACYRGELDRGNYAAATALRVEISGPDGNSGALAEMMVDQLGQQASDPDQIVMYGG